MEALRVDHRVVAVVVDELEADVLVVVLEVADLDHVLRRDRGHRSLQRHVLEVRDRQDHRRLGVRSRILRHHGKGEDEGDGQQQLPGFHGWVSDVGNGGSSPAAETAYDGRLPVFLPAISRLFFALLLVFAAACQRQVAAVPPTSAELLAYVDVVAGTGEVLIRVGAAGVNRPDCLQRAGAYPPPPGASDLPGLEVAGTVVACGAGVGWPMAGERVCALCNGGGYAGYVAVRDGEIVLAAAGLPVLPSVTITRRTWASVRTRATARMPAPAFTVTVTGPLGATLQSTRRSFAFCTARLATSPPSTQMRAMACSTLVHCARA